MEFLKIIVFVWRLLTMGSSTAKIDNAKCIPLKECSYGMNLVSTQKYAPSTIDFLRKSHCGYSKLDGPLIMCPPSRFDCITSEGKNGICKDIQDCDTLINTNLIIKDLEDCQKSRDTDDTSLKVCCYESDFRNFKMKKPKGYEVNVILEEDSTLQQVTQPPNNNIDRKGKSKNFNSVEEDKIYIPSTERYIPQDGLKQSTKSVFNNFLKELNEQSEKTDNVNFSLMADNTEPKTDSPNTLENLKPEENETIFPKNSQESMFQDFLKDLNGKSSEKDDVKFSFIPNDDNSVKTIPKLSQENISETDNVQFALTSNDKELNIQNRTKVLNNWESRSKIIPLITHRSPFGGLETFKNLENVGKSIKSANSRSTPLKNTRFNSVNGNKNLKTDKADNNKKLTLRNYFAKHIPRGPNLSYRSGTENNLNNVDILNPLNISKNSSHLDKFIFRIFSRKPSRHYYKPYNDQWDYGPPKPVNRYNDVDILDQPNVPRSNWPNPRDRPTNGNFACGREARPDRMSSRIIGGMPVALGEYPWMVLIQYTGSSGVINGCGGSLINSKFFLTAAHCVDKPLLRHRNLNLYRVILGEYDTSADPDCISRPNKRICAEPNRIYGISNITQHPDFDRVIAINDIALVKLDRDVEFSDYIKPICLPPKGFSYGPNESVMVAGWGRTIVGGAYSQILNKAALPIVDKEMCTRRGVTLNDGQICLGMGNGIDTCTGDSGGPMMIQRIENSNLVTYQFGIISYGFASEDCGQAPSVNTLTIFYLDWIYSVLQKSERENRW